MRFCSLSSGSEGNALLIEAQGNAGHVSRLLIDCGLGLREAETRLEERGLAAKALDFIFVTHEHGDHVGGVAKLARAHGIPVLATQGTINAMGCAFWADVAVARVSPHQPLEIDGVVIQPIPVPHDAREPVAIVVSNATHRLGIVTDLGHRTAHLMAGLQGLDGLFLEFNYDEALLRGGSYPASLKSRIEGPYGHLSNRTSAEILAGAWSTRLQRVVAAHLSQQNNRPELVQESIAGIALGDAAFCCASQARGLDWVELA